MKRRRGALEEEEEDDGPADPYAELFRIKGKAKANEKEKDQEEGNVTNSMTMLTAIPEVDLGMEWVHLILFLHTFLTQNCSARLKNIEETEKAKRQVAEERKDRKRPANDEEHLAAARCEELPFTHRHLVLTLCEVYRPNLKTKSDADILRDAKLEAMGLAPEEHEHRPQRERPQMATDELVCLRHLTLLS